MVDTPFREDPVSFALCVGGKQILERAKGEGYVPQAGG